MVGVLTLSLSPLYCASKISLILTLTMAHSCLVFTLPTLNQSSSFSVPLESASIGTRWFSQRKGVGVGVWGGGWGISLWSLSEVDKSFYICSFFLFPICIVSKPTNLVCIKPHLGLGIREDKGIKILKKELVVVSSYQHAGRGHHRNCWWSAGENLRTFVPKLL